MKLLITNGSNHPPDKWADATTEAILDLVQIADNSVTPAAAIARQAKRDLAPKLFNILNSHHGEVQDIHRSALEKQKKSQVGQPIDVEQHMGNADLVLIELAKTPFSEHFAKPEVQVVVRQIIGQHTADVIHIERLHAADKLKG